MAGRAELLSAVFSFLAFLCFTSACARAQRSARSKKRFLAVAAACTFFALSTLAKETGFTVLGALWAYDLLHNGDLLGRLRAACGCCCGGGRGSVPKLDADSAKFGEDSFVASRDKCVGDSVSIGSDAAGASERISPACSDGTAFGRAFLSRHVPLLLSAAMYLTLRRKLSHRFSPEISPRDNHLALEPEWLTRVLSYASLHGRYAALLLYPTVWHAEICLLASLTQCRLV